MMNLPKLDQRLECAASFVPNGSRVCDVGTDHAYLPIYLVGKGISPEALATDINQGPVDRALINVSLYGLADRIKVRRADGLCGAIDFYPDAVLILGMGGELIVRIISDADWLADDKRPVRLILQPMTHPEYVRKYLLENGFRVVDEKICESGKFYDVMAAEYDGVKRTIDDFSALIGQINLARGDSVTRQYAAHLADIHKRRIDGLKKSGADTSEEERIYVKLLNFAKA